MLQCMLRFGAGSGYPAQEFISADACSLKNWLSCAEISE